MAVARHFLYLRYYILYLGEVIAGGAGLAVGDGASTPYPAFILFTTRNERYKETEMRNFANRGQCTAFAFCLGVIGGIAANGMTYLLW